MHPYFIATATGFVLFLLAQIWSELKRIRKCLYRMEVQKTLEK